MSLLVVVAMSMIVVAVAVIMVVTVTFTMLVVMVMVVLMAVAFDVLIEFVLHAGIVDSVEHPVFQLGLVDVEDRTHEGEVDLAFRPE